MRPESHRVLGQFLVARFMPDHPKRYIRAFMLGCIEPDKNPTTYLKGSLRSQWLRGHNYHNARKYMDRVCVRLCKKELKLADYYALGKLIHYTADAFTLAHNTSFGGKLVDHRRYERLLHSCFMLYIQNARLNVRQREEHPSNMIRRYHKAYCQCRPGVDTDVRFILRICCQVLPLLLGSSILPQEEKVSSFH
jgi:hypothetical protein